jgi:hypothetical protein
VPGSETPAIGSTVGEAFAIAPDTYVVPGWWSFPETGLGLPLGTLVVRGQATAVVDTAPAPLEDDWLAAVLALVDPAEVRWIVATAVDPVRAGCVAALHALAPRATVVVPGGRCTTLDLGRGQVVDLHEDRVTGHFVAEVRARRVLWTDIVGGAFPRPAVDVVTVDDDTMIAALARRPRPLGRDEVERAEALGPRVLGSPIGPVARGAGVARALDLARRAEEVRSSSSLTLDALVAPLGPAPLTSATVAAPAAAPAPS